MLRLEKSKKGINLSHFHLREHYLTPLVVEKSCKHGSAYIVTLRMMNNLKIVKFVLLINIQKVNIQTSQI